jgi:hypothetical protein
VRPVIAAVLALAFAASAGAQDVRLERFETRIGAVQQDGYGLESRATPNARGRGSSELLVFQPLFFARIRQSEDVTHDVYAGVDVVTSASADALDAVSSASRQNESFEIDGFSTLDLDDDHHLRLHWGGHLEEPLRSGTLGVAGAVDVAEDNATFTASLDAIYDTFDHLTFLGRNRGISNRITLSFNTSLTQVLSASTLASVSYGFTAQVGTLETTYNSVPLDNGDRIGDLFPDSRLRHAVAIRVVQALPTFCTFFEAAYRFYADDFGIVAHTPEIAMTHFVEDAFSFRLSYRFHTQKAPSFWTSVASRDERAFRTADSDLESFDAHELGGSVRWYYDLDGAVTAESSYVVLDYHHYVRTNDLYANLVSIGWGVDL